MSGHRWATLADTHPEDGPCDDVDRFAGESNGWHNGPRCLDCGRRGCQHCEPGMLTEECPGPVEQAS